MLSKAPRGTKDITPKDVYKWHYIEKKFREICALYGYEEIRTPIFEHTEVFARSVGDTTDVVQKEMYSFTDRGDRQLSLKPEGTAGVIRSFIENKALRINKKINTLSFSYENIPEWFIKDVKENKERNLCLEYSEKYSFNLLGEKIDVLKLKSYFNLFVDEIENSEETKKIHLILKENDENKTYESVQLFKNEYDLEKFLSNKDHLTELQNAKC